MSLTPQEEVQRLIAQGENAAVEFKGPAVRPESIARELVAMANARGGSLLLGVRDDGHIEGLDSQRNHEEWLINIARSGCVPPLEVTCTMVTLEAGQVLLVRVPKGLHKPYQTSDGRYLVRVGSTNRNASAPELLRLFQAGGFFHFDLTAVEGSDHRHLDTTRLSRYFQRYTVAFDELPPDERLHLLRNADILSESGACTVGGLLIFGSDPQRFLDQAAISLAVYDGQQPAAELLDRQTFTGPLDAQIDQAVPAILRNLPEVSHIEGTKRVTGSPRLPDVVFRELLVNAVAHRSYAIAGSRVRVQIFTDRIEIISPGRLPNTVSIAKLRAGVSYAINPVVVKFLENLGYIDRLGRGLPMVCRTVESQGLSVDFNEIGEEFQVVIGRTAKDPQRGVPG
jgi:ATP-dependent DNA helicase RecG